MKKIAPILIIGVIGVGLFMLIRNKKVQQQSRGVVTPQPPPKHKTKAGTFLQSLLKSAPDIYASVKQADRMKGQEQNKNNPYVTAPSSHNAPPSNLPSWM